MKGEITMIMTDEEIVIDYKNAKNKRTQINILAELNCCDPNEIIEVLERNNIVHTQPKKKKQKVYQEQHNTEKVKVEVESDSKEYDPLQATIDCLVEKSLQIQDEILEKEKALEKLTAAIESVKQAQAIMEGGNGNVQM